MNLSRHAIPATTLLHLILGCLVFLPAQRAWTQSGTQTPSIQVPPAPPAEVDRLRRNLQQLQRQREARADESDLIPLANTHASPPRAIADALPGLNQARSRVALIRLVHDMDAHNAVWSFEPLDAKASTPPFRIPLVLRGEQWITLRAGRYRLTLLVGRPGHAERLRLAPRTIKLDSGDRRELVLGERTEQELRRRVRRSQDHARPSAQAPDPALRVARGGLQSPVRHALSGLSATDSGSFILFDFRDNELLPVRQTSASSIRSAATGRSLAESCRFVRSL